MTSFSSSGIPNSFRNLALASLNLSVSSSSLTSWFLLYSAMIPCGSVDTDGRVATQSSQKTVKFVCSGFTWTFPLTKVVMSFSFSKMERVCSRLCSSHSQCSVISLRELPGEQRGGGVRALS